MRDDPERWARQAETWSRDAYAEPRLYLEQRAELVERLGRRLERGALVLDLCCGDGALGLVLLEHGFRYRGSDLEPRMVEAATRLLAGRGEVEVGDLDTYVPPEPVDATTLFRAIYYSRDHRALFTRIRSFTRVKIVFDVNPRTHPLAGFVADLKAAGWEDVVARPLFASQSVRLPVPVAKALRVLERTGPLARLILRARFTYVVSASPSAS